MPTVCSKCTAGMFIECASAVFRGMSAQPSEPDRKSTRLNSSHLVISYAVFCLKKQRPSSLTYLDRRVGRHRFARTIFFSSAPLLVASRNPDCATHIVLLHWTIPYDLSQRVPLP